MASTVEPNWDAYVIEGCLLATFMFVACAGTVLMAHPRSPVAQAVRNSIARRAVMGVLMGLTAVALIYSPWGQRSGAHLNPGTTVTFLVLGKVRWVDAVGYVLSQFVGGLAGVGAARTVLFPAVRHEAVRFAATTPGARGRGAAWAAEFIIACLLMLTVLLCSNRRDLAPYTGIIAGVLVALFIVVEAPLSGMSMNPARTLGSAAFARVYRGLWIYFTAPPLGMLCAAGIYVGVFGDRVYCAKMQHGRQGPCHFNCQFDRMPGRTAERTPERGIQDDSERSGSGK